MISSMRSILGEVIDNALYRPHMFRWIIQERPLSYHISGDRIRLGRWDYNITKEQLERRIDLANTDNCAYNYATRY
jgi:hypothetical protein